MKKKTASESLDAQKLENLSIYVYSKDENHILGLRIQVLIHCKYRQRLVTPPRFEFLGQLLHQASEVVPVRPLPIPGTVHMDQSTVIYY
jgi:hypothetical protein